MVAGQPSQMGADTNMEANLSMFGGLALVSDVAPQCRWSRRWLIFIPQALKNQLCGKRSLKRIVSHHTMPQFSTNQWFCPSACAKISTPKSWTCFDNASKWVLPKRGALHKYGDDNIHAWEYSTAKCKLHYFLKAPDSPQPPFYFRALLTV